MSLDRADIHTISELGRSLWSDPAQSAHVSSEVIAAVSTLDYSTEKAIERAARALLDRAPGDTTPDHPFFRLAAEERFALCALHLNQWSYDRVARILGFTPEDVQRVAWQARVALASTPGLHFRGRDSHRRIPYPTAPEVQGIHCPEYDPAMPWTQKMLDDEIPPSEEVFLQTHLMACDSCRNALTRARDVYYVVESILPRISSDDEITLPENLSLTDLSLRERIQISARIFSKRWDVRIAFGVLILTTVMLFF